MLAKTGAEQRQPLRQFVKESLDLYFSELDPSTLPTNLYALVLEEVEPSLLATTLNFTEGNQTEAARILGISRSTLRKKLKQYQLDSK